MLDQSVIDGADHVIKVDLCDEVEPLISGIRSKQPDIQYWAVGSLSSLLQVGSRVSLTTTILMKRRIIRIWYFPLLVE